MYMPYFGKSFRNYVYKTTNKKACAQFIFADQFLSLKKMKEINVALVGKVGHGKSATGNTILQRMAFDEYAGLVGIGTQLLELKRCSIDINTTLKLYDTSGLMSLQYNGKRSKELMREEMDRLMEFEKEIHVFVLVISYTSKFTAEEKETVFALKEMFGENFVKDHGMIVVTHGDYRDSESLRAGISTQDMFNEWCRNNLNDLKSDITENILLVNNKGDFNVASKRLKSSQDLRGMILQVSQTKAPFTKEEYENLKKKCVIM